MGLAAQIADKMGNPFVKADALEKQGMARDRRGDLAGAVRVWQAAAALEQDLRLPRAPAVGAGAADPRLQDARSG